MINDLWYKHAVVYCLSTETFLDSNGDGIGDFRGLLRRLDYLDGLGVTTLWLMPFQPSPRRDDGYDPSDFYGIDPRYGTLGDFVELTHAARQRGMRIIMDLVVNHTSDQHPWFQDARRSPQSRYRSWYIWSRKKPRDANKGMVFPGVQKSTWSYDEVAKAWYFHRFYDFQPDLNAGNPEVQSEILRIVGFWIQLGVSGFRMDATPFLISRKGAGVTRLTRRFDLLRAFRELVQWRQGDAILLAEANVPPDKSRAYFGPDGERLQMLFNFRVNETLFHALATADAQPLIRALRKTSDRPLSGQWALFLRNHDELDLSGLTPAQRGRVYQKFAPEPDMRLYRRGIRRRLAPMLGGDRRKLELAYSLLFTLPGTSVLLYGDEIGMGDDLSLPERRSIRTPMQWSAEPHAGFTESDQPVTPVIARGAYGYRHVNVAAQRRDPGSLVNWMERIIRMRAEIPEIGWGDATVLDSGNPAVLMLRYDWRNNAVLFLHNLSGVPVELRFRPRRGRGAEQLLVNLLSEHHSRAGRNGRHCVLLEPYGYRWFRVGGLDYLLRRSDI